MGRLLSNDRRVTFVLGNGLSSGDGSDILKYIFAAFVVLKSRFGLVDSAELLLKQRRILRVGLFHANGVKQLLFVFEHRNITSFGSYCFRF